MSPTTGTKWKQKAPKRLSDVFERAKTTNDDQEVTVLYERNGPTPGRAGGAKRMATCLSADERKRLIEPRRPLSIVRQCELLDINRAEFCYEPKGETSFNPEFMCKIDEHYTKTPFYGART